MKLIEWAKNIKEGIGVAAKKDTDFEQAKFVEELLKFSIDEMIREAEEMQAWVREQPCVNKGSEVCVGPCFPCRARRG